MLRHSYIEHYLIYCIAKQSHISSIKVMKISKDQFFGAGLYGLMCELFARYSMAELKTEYCVYVRIELEMEGNAEVLIPPLVQSDHLHNLTLLVHLA